MSIPGLCSVEWWGDLVIGKNLEVNDNDMVKVLSWHLPGGPEEKHKNRS
jgi:hypothetical protein